MHKSGWQKQDFVTAICQQPNTLSIDLSEIIILLPSFSDPNKLLTL